MFKMTNQYIKRFFWILNKLESSGCKVDKEEIKAMKRYYIEHPDEINLIMMTFRFIQKCGFSGITFEGNRDYETGYFYGTMFKVDFQCTGKDTKQCVKEIMDKQDYIWKNQPRIGHKDVRIFLKY